MNVFISHNKADKEIARLLAVALVEQGESVWFDEWQVRPGDSIIGGIEAGLSSSDVFLLVWSSSASLSKWVGVEVSAYLRRRVEDESLRIVPVMVDATPLPTLVADYRGFIFDQTVSPNTIAFEITGKPSDIKIARLLQNRLMKITSDHCDARDPLPYIICPSCGSANMKRSSTMDYERDEVYYIIDCEDCNWSDWSQ
jgi:hypothetical protein